ncbi:MAG: glutamate racemase [Deltaproteobacteria bacterium]|nr:glutamate racemase [Deltaproteobacteria bacterium]MBW2252973.1 glutamate racemase [Deltaproteobacteria bacterium]
MLVGVFDSGIGGLTVLRELATALPEHDLVYLGDTARVPYGTRSPETVIRYSLRVSSYLADLGVGALVVACNTASTHALPALRLAGDRAGIQVFGVVEPGVEAALEVHHTGAIAVLGTEGTIRGRAYQDAIRLHAPDVPVEAIPCPLFVPLAEEGWVEGLVPEQVAEHYLGHLRGRVDTAILGCTHYPALAPILHRVLPGVDLVDSARATAKAVRTAFGPPSAPTGTVRFLVTDHPERFQRVGRIFFGHDPVPVEWVDLGPAKGPFAMGR